MRRALIMLLSVSCAVQAQTLHRATDARGIPLFTDDPARSGVRYEPRPLSVVPSPREAPVAEPVPDSMAEPGPGDDGEEAAPAVPFAPYDGFRILAPADGQTLPLGQAGDVAVRLGIEPALRASHRVRLLVDGHPVEAEPHGDAFHLSGLGRGRRVLEAELLDAFGEVRQRSPSVTIHVLRAGIHLPGNPQRPR